MNQGQTLRKTERRLRLTQLRATLFSLATIAIAVVLGGWSLQQIHAQSQAAIASTLKSVLNQTNQTLSIWHNNQIHMLEGLAKDPELVILTQLQLDAYHSGNPLQSETLTDIRRFFKAREDRFGNTGFFIIAADGSNIASMRDSNIGWRSLIKKHRPQRFQQVLDGRSVFIPPIPSDVALPDAKRIKGLDVPATLFFAAPIKDQSGQVIAILTQRLNPHNDFSQLNLAGIFGSSGETFSFDHHGMLLSKSRFTNDLISQGMLSPDEQSIYSFSFAFPEMLNTQKNISGSGHRVNGDLSSYSNYRNKKVFGIWLWNSKLDIGIATEIEESEALMLYRFVRRLVIVTLCIIVLFALTSSFFAVRASVRESNALKAANSELESLVAERTTRLSKQEEQLRESNRRISLAADSAAIGIWELNLETEQLQWDDWMFRIYGIAQDQFGECLDAWHKLIHPEDAERFRQAIDQLGADDEVMDIEFRIIRNQDDLRYIKANAVLSSDKHNPIRRLVGVNLDVTDSIQAQKALQSAKEQADAATRAKSEFLASMSHEIRTPMNGVLGMLGLIQNGELNKEQRRKLGIAQTSARSLLALINDILDLSKVEAGKLHLENVDFNLKVQIEQTLQILAFKAQEKGLELAVNVSGIKTPMVVGDPYRLGQIINNLVGNAIKFTEHGSILLRAELHPNTDHSLSFNCSVCDTGIGIPEDKVATLFDSFTQVDASTTRRYGGSGLGLAITKKLCNLMQGDITVNSEVGKGSCFEFNLSFKKSDVSQRVIPDIDFSRLKVLVVDDNPVNREIFIEQLKLWGASVASAEHASAALDYLNSEKDRLPDVALIDMQMPDMDGLVLGKVMQQEKAFKAIKRLLMTSIIDPASKEELIEHGFSGCFSKPVTTSDLFDALTFVASSEPNVTEDDVFITSSNLAKLMATTNLSAERLVSSYTAKKMPWPEASRILLVEDNLINQQVVLGMLEELGLDCDMVADGKQALDILRNSAHDKPYTLVFMDCQMPVLDGYATTECIRKGDAGERYITIPIVAMTAHAIAGNREKCLNSGMNDYISKPLEHETLFSILLTWLKPGDDTPQKGQNLSRPPANSGVNNDVLQTTLDDHIYWKSNDALRRVAGKPERLRKLITMYFNDMPSRIANLQQQLSDLDMAEAARNLHTIKSVAGNLGGSKLQEIATIMERYAQNGLQQEVAEALPALLDANEQLSNALEGYLKQSAPSAPN